MRKQSLTLTEILEHPTFQFWFFFVSSTAIYCALWLPTRDNLLVLLGISLVWAFGILGVIYVTDHADNPYWNISFWLRAVAATGTAIMLPGIVRGIVPAGAELLVVVLIPVVPIWHGQLLSLAFKESFACCLWWVLGGLSLVFLTAIVGTALYSFVVSFFT